MNIPKAGIYCAFTLVLGVASGILLKSPKSKLHRQWQEQRLAIAAITQVKPHNEIRTKGESELILHQAESSCMSPSDFSCFLVGLDRIKLQHVNDSLKSLIVFHDFAKARFDSPKDKDHADFFRMQLSQSGEVYVIHSQLLEREISAIQAWEPGLTAEQCLALADTQTHK